MTTPRVREAVRAVVLADNAVPLCCFVTRGGPLWALPGGGIEPGETNDAAIRRELEEELGLRDFELGPVIWERTHFFDFSEDFDGQHETFFLIRTPRFAITPAFTKAELRAEGVDGVQWWTVDELLRLDARFAPRRLPALLQQLLADGPPASVVDVGV
jgi:8-oxo-dGTP pyrophosphatase MutT (NUDIX family)